jgi:hypothetical protein
MQMMYACRAAVELQQKLWKEWSSSKLQHQQQQ